MTVSDGNSRIDGQRGKTDGAALTGRDLLLDLLPKLPDAPGVYRMINRHGDVLYVGKAKSLRKRLASYTRSRTLSNRISQMVMLTADLEIVRTNTEAEALLLEANLIKRFKPRFNVLLRDDKSFPFILIAGDHDYPQLMKHRGAQRRAGDYFGPFASAGAVNVTLNALQRAFLLRSCSDTVFANRTRPCLLYQIKRCSAPCVGKISVGDYKKLVDDTKNFLSGGRSDIQQQLSKEMQTASDNLEFERAAALRDRIAALTRIQMRQDINLPKVGEADVIAGVQNAGQTCIQVFFFRNGQNWGNRSYFPRHDETHSLGDVLGAFIGQFYENKRPPKQILVNDRIEGARLIGEALSVRSGRKITLSQPKRGAKRNLIEHAEKNAKSALDLRLAESASQRQILEDIADVFELEAAPERIEVYDNSHISGSNAVGAMIVGGPEGFNKNAYRKFNIKSDDLVPGDDYAMIREVMQRRFSRLVKEDPDRVRGQWPDLVLIDGGAGQLSAACDILQDLGIEDLPIAAIAKGPDRDAGREKFFMPRRRPFSLPERSPALYYLQRLRDEAHRFAVGSHRIRRKKNMTASPLDEVPGIGARRKKALLNHFGSAKAVQDAQLVDLQAVPGISKALAQSIFDHFHPNQ